MLKWNLTQDSFNKLLMQLGSTAEDAGQEYERIRGRLIKYFEWQKCSDPEMLADETINRVTRGLEEGKEIWTSSPLSFFYGVARNIAREQWGKQKTISLEQLGPRSPHLRPQNENSELEKSRDEEIGCLEICARVLPDDQRNLIISYYFGEKSMKIKRRKELADELGITMNALRIRAHRIREELEACVAGCVARKGTRIDL
jgi:DNA-directed RNA polymerase specialized sigma24 family protein